MMIHLTPAECAIKAFGRVVALSNATGISPPEISRWRRKKENHNGCSGLIPTRAMIARILKAAKERQLPLTAEDLVFGRDEMVADPEPVHAA